LWQLHDRLPEEITAESCTAEIQSFTEYGQMIPVLGRPLRGDPHHEIELIYGARRLFVARQINQPLLVELREISDLEAIISMDLENRQRQDLSPYERGLSYGRWLRSGHFKSQDEMARSLKVSTAHISRLLKLARLPSIVVGAFGSGAEIWETWGLELMDALNDSARRQPILRTARMISGAGPRPAAAEVLRRLLAAGTRGHRPKNTLHDVVIKDRAGAPLFRVRRQRDSMTYLLPPDKISAKVLEKIERAVANILANCHADEAAEEDEHLRLHVA